MEKASLNAGQWQLMRESGYAVAVTDKGAHSRRFPDKLVLLTIPPGGRTEGRTAVRQAPKINVRNRKLSFHCLGRTEFLVGRVLRRTTNAAAYADGGWVDGGGRLTGGHH